MEIQGIFPNMVKTDKVRNINKSHATVAYEYDGDKYAADVWYTDSMEG